MKNYHYKDINLDFAMNPATSDIITATDVEAIKKSVRNLILTNMYEIPFNPETGTNIQESLFENFSPITTDFLKAKISEALELYEPRVSLEATEIFQREDYNSLEISIYFRILELNINEELTIFVERTR